MGHQILGLLISILVFPLAVLVGIVYQFVLIFRIVKLKWFTEQEVAIDPDYIWQNNMDVKNHSTKTTERNYETWELKNKCR